MITRGLLQLAYSFIAPAIFLLFVISYFMGFFEHDEGWHDLDTMEMIFIVFFFLLSKRFFSQRHREGISWWEVVRRYCHYSVLYHLLTISPMLAVLVAEESLQVFREYVDLYDLISMFGYLLVLFAYAPAPRISHKGEDIESSVDLQEEEVQNAS